LAERKKIFPASMPEKFFFKGSSMTPATTPRFFLKTPTQFFWHYEAFTVIRHGWRKVKPPRKVRNETFTRSTAIPQAEWRLPM